MKIESLEDTKDKANSEDDRNGNGNGIQNDGFASDPEIEEVDPLNSVPESTVADEDGIPMPSQGQGDRLGHPSQAVVLDPSINLTISQIGLRQLMGRKPEPRPKPLLEIVCKGCLRSTFDQDEFIKGDYNECLVSQPV